MSKTIPDEEQTSEALAARVVCFRVLKINKESSIKAMDELYRRKLNGDDFDYEAYIESKIKDMPSPTVGNEQINNVKSMIKSIKNGTI